MGGRYQTIHVDFNGCSPGAATGWFSKALRVASSCSKGTSRPGVFNSEPPGVFGAPNEANAPDPRPKAEEALVDGEETPPDNGDIALNGFERPCELSGPKRLDGRGSSTRAPSFASPDVDRDNLDELIKRRNHHISHNDHLEEGHTTNFVRRVHRFALSIAAGEKTARGTSGHQGERKGSVKSVTQRDETPALLSQ